MVVVVKTERDKRDDKWDQDVIERKGKGEG
jgi:hypothetical protein